MKKSVGLIVFSMALALGQNALAETKYKGTEDTVTTRICLAAAKKGFDAAEKLFKAEKLARASSIKSIQCNGMSVAEFANTYYLKDTETKLALNSSQK